MQAARVFLPIFSPDTSRRRISMIHGHDPTVMHYRWPAI
jgi:hypothetical protein